MDTQMFSRISNLLQSSHSGHRIETMCLSLQWYILYCSRKLVHQLSDKLFILSLAGTLNWQSYNRWLSSWNTLWILSMFLFSPRYDIVTEQGFDLVPPSSVYSMNYKSNAQYYNVHQCFILKQNIVYFSGMMGCFSLRGLMEDGRWSIFSIDTKRVRNYMYE